MDPPRPVLSRWPRRAGRALARISLAFVALALVARRAVVIDFPARAEAAVDLRLPVAERERVVVDRAGRLLDAYVSASRASGVVLLALGGEVRMERAFGLPGGAATTLTFGSLPKQLTGYLIHRLAGEGLLGLDQRAGDLLPELRDAPAGAVTVDQLLHMTSGLPLNVDAPTNLSLQVGGAWMDDGELLRRIRGYPPAFPPGSAFLYSNVGYRLLAILASRVTGQPWPALLRARVLEPAGMASAALFEPGVPAPPDLPPGHLPVRCALLFGSPCMLDLPRWNYSALWGAGAMHARARDWLSWTRFLGKLATDEPDFFARYTKPGREGYAAGISPTEITAAGGERVRVFAYSGEDPGYHGYLAWIPSLDATVVWLTNSDYCFTSDYSPGKQLVALVAGAPYEVVAR